MALETIFNPQNLFYVSLVIVFLVYWVFSFIVFYHLIRFGIGTLPKKIATVYFMGSVVFFCIVFLLFVSVDLSVVKSNIILLFSGINN
jgi:hypothetical protein